MATDLTLISQLPQNDKRSLFAMLARELLAAGAGRAEVSDSTGDIILYAVPASARANAERAIRDADPVYLVELHRRATDRSEVMNLDEVLALGGTTDRDSTPRT